MSDESIPIQFGSKVWVWYKPHDAIDPSCQQDTVQDAFVWHELSLLAYLDMSLMDDHYVALIPWPFLLINSV